MDRNWPYVATGYLLTAGVLGAYTTWLLRKLRRVERLDDLDHVDHVDHADHFDHLESAQPSP
jgi:hypothetical protein